MTPWVRRGVLLLVLLFAGSGFHLVRQISERFHETLLRSEDERMNNELILTQDRLQPHNLLREGLLACLTGIDAIDETTVGSCAAALHAWFGDQIRWVAWNSEGRIVGRQRFSDLETQCFIGIWKDFHMSETSSPTLDLEQALFLQNQARLFGKSFGSTENINRISVMKVTYGGVRGYLMLAYLYDGTVPGRRFMLTKGSYQRSIRPEFYGAITAFVPVKAAENDEWIMKSAKRIYSDQIVRHASLDVESRRVRWVESSGDLLSGFYRLAVGSDSCILRFERRLVAGALSPIGTIGRLVVVWLLPLAALTIVYLNVGERWSWSVMRKFLVVAVLVGLGPSVGLLWSRTELGLWRTAIEREERYQRLDDRLSTFEQEFVTLRSRMVTMIKRFLLDLQRLPRGTRDSRFNALVDKLSRETAEATGEPIALNMLRAAETVMFSTDAVPGDSRRPEDRVKYDNIQQLIVLLLEGMRTAFAIASQNMQQTMQAARGEIVVEALEQMLGAEQLYNSVSRHDQLVGFQFWAERMWAYIHVFRQAGSPDRDLMLFNLRRKFIQRNLMVDWTARQLDASGRFREPVPSMVFGSAIDNDYFLSFEPLNRYPIFSQVVQRLARDGGVQRFSFAHAGATYDALARKLTDMDVVGISIEKVSVPETTWTQVTSIGMIVYPLLVVLLSGTLFRRFVLEPLVTLRSGVARMQRGEYALRLPVLSDDEIGDVCRGFNRMAAGLQEKEMMSRFLSRLTIEAVAKSEAPPATRCRAAVMFSDIRGFTTISEARPAEEIVEMLNDYLTCMEEVIEAHGGMIDKFIGDAIMAVFLPVLGRADPSERAARAALAMRSALAEFNERRRESGLFEIQTGIGIASGEVLMGVLEGARRQDFTVTGPTVNHAAQMEKRSKEAVQTHIVICAHSRESLDRSALCRPLAQGADGRHPDQQGWELINLT